MFDLCMVFDGIATEPHVLQTWGGCKGRFPYGHIILLDVKSNVLPNNNSYIAEAKLLEDLS